MLKWGAAATAGLLLGPAQIGALAAAVVEGVSGSGRYPCTRVAADGSFSPGKCSSLISWQLRC